MKAMRVVWYALVLLGLFGSCRKAGTEQKEAVAQLMGKEIVFPPELSYQIQTTPVDYRPGVADYTLVAYIDSAGCVGCRLRLGAWTRIINSLKADDDLRVDFAMILNSTEAEHIATLIKDNFLLPVCFDPQGLFRERNGLTTDEFYNYFLLDSDHKIIAVGNPALSPKIRDFYMQAIGPKQPEGGLCENPVSAIGAVSPGDTIRREFFLVNKSEKPLSIQELVPSCYCLTARADSDTIPAKSSAMVRVEYTPEEERGQIETYVDIFFNEKDNPERLTLYGYSINNQSIH